MISGALAVPEGHIVYGLYVCFVRNMVAGRGFIGLSASNMVAGSPLGVLVSSFIFGSADVFANILQMTSAPADLVLMLPYAITIPAWWLYRSCAGGVRKNTKSGDPLNIRRDRLMKKHSVIIDCDTSELMTLLQLLPHSAVKNWISGRLPLCLR